MSAMSATSLAVLRRFREYVQDPEFRSHWEDLKIPGDFSPEVLLTSYLDDSRVRPWLNQHAEKVATRSTAPLPVTREELIAIVDRYRERVQEAGRTLAHLSDGEVNKSDRQKKFIAYVAEHPQFADAWKIGPILAKNSARRRCSGISTTAGRFGIG